MLVLLLFPLAIVLKFLIFMAQFIFLEGIVCLLLSTLLFLILRCLTHKLAFVLRCMNPIFRGFPSDTLISFVFWAGEENKKSYSCLGFLPDIQLLALCCSMISENSLGLNGKILILFPTMALNIFLVMRLRFSGIIHPTGWRADTVRLGKSVVTTGKLRSFSKALFCVVWKMRSLFPISKIT